MATIKHKIAFKKVLKGTSISKAMSEVGYADSTSKSTGKLTRTKGWQELVDKYISEEKLMKVHAEGLNAYKIKQGAVLGGEIGLQSAEIQEPDFATRHKYLETGYKVRGRMKEPEKPGDIHNQFNFFDAEQLKRIARRIQDDDSKSEPEAD